MSRRVLITGAGGFIGSHVVEAFVESGLEVRAFVHYNSIGSQGWLESSPIGKQVEVVAGDVSDYDSVHSATRGCDSVVHMAALIGIPYSYASPLAYIRTNVEGTYNVVQSARERDIQNVLVTSTSETYGTAQYVPINETHPAVGQSPYAATKIAADQIALSYWRSFETPIKVVRPFNTFGPRQSARAIIPTVISQIAGGRTTLNLGALSPTRDFTYVKDTASAFLAIHECDSLIGQEVNIGMSDEISIGDLVYLIAEIMEADVSITTDEKRLRPEASEVHRLFCDNSKLVEHTGWTAKYGLRKGLAETEEWVRNNLDVFKTDQYAV